MLFGIGFCVVALLVSPRSPVAPSVHPVRFLLVGANFGLLSAALAISPLGRRSGAHLNPAVTIAFWLRGYVHRHDLAGYLGAQFLGAFGGTAAFSVLAGDWAASINFARTSPMAVGAPAGVAIEAVLTFALIVAVFLCLSAARLMRWTPLVAATVLTGLIWAGSPATGASLNPARSLAPAIIDTNAADLWVYFAGPLIGAALAGLAAVGVRLHPMTAKMCHGHDCNCAMACGIRPAPGNGDGPAEAGPSPTPRTWLRD